MFSVLFTCSRCNHDSLSCHSLKPEKPETCLTGQLNHVKQEDGSSLGQAGLFRAGYSIKTINLPYLKILLTFASSVRKRHFNGRKQQKHHQTAVI
ncbi:hypothetical protein DYJ25_11640 [Prevotella denticola]|nr:hypothetical protein DYJ25_11640 [Prevotella denticola]